jgi:ketosteroid isomerase-like protein
MKNLLFTFLLLSFVVLVRAQEFTNENLQSMVNAERSFSKLAETKNTRDAFLANLNEQSLAFQQGQPSNAKAKWESATAGPEWLYWLPSYADISASGDFGFTYGPWSYRSNKTVEAPEATGHFITVWKKQSDNTWKIAIDVGVSHEAYEVNGHPIKTSAIATPAAKILKVTAKTDLQHTQQVFNESVKKDPVKTYTQWASKEITYFREGSLPMTSTTVAVKDLALSTFTTIDVQVSSAGDLGFTYGTITRATTDGTSPKKIGFVQIWKKEDGKNWKLVLDFIA